MTSVEFYFDYKSPYAYLADSQLGKLGVALDYRPISVLAVMKLVNNTPTTFSCAPKLRYANADVGRWAQRYGLAVSFHPQFREIEGPLLSRGALAAQELDCFASYHRAIFDALWRDRADLLAPSGRAEILDAHGVPGEQLWSLANSREIAAKLDASNAQAAQRGVFGSPTFFVGDDLFFGNDRLDFVRERLAMSQ